MENSITALESSLAVFNLLELKGGEGRRKFSRRLSYPISQRSAHRMRATLCFWAVPPWVRAQSHPRQGGVQPQGGQEAAPPINPLAGKLPYALGAAIKTKKKKKKRIGL